MIKKTGMYDLFTNQLVEDSFNTHETQPSTSNIFSNLHKKALASKHDMHQVIHTRKRRLSLKEMDAFRKAINNAVVEKDVEVAYKNLFNAAFKYNEDNLLGEIPEWVSPFQCDGYFKNHAIMLYLLFEAKFDENFLEKEIKCQTLLQALYYIKKIKEDPNAQYVVPNVVMIGDKNECFIVAESALDKYLKENLNWEIAPSHAGSDPSNKDVVLKMVDDNGISPYVYKINDEKVDLNEVFHAIELIAKVGNFQKTKITAHNLRRVYEQFLRCVIDENNNFTIANNKKMTEQDLSLELVNIFMGSIIYRDLVRFNSKKKNYIEIPILFDSINLTGGGEWNFYTNI